MNKLSLFICSLLIVTAYSGFPQQNVTKGPAKGTLVIVGGGQTDSSLKYFMKIIGGMDQPVVIIGTASLPTENEFTVDYKKLLKLGATNVRILHTADRNVANSDTFTAPLRTAKGVWFAGGRQWRLVDAYKGTKTEKMIREVLNRGGAIGGTSAGASIQGSYLVRGDTKTNQIVMGDHEEGFGYIDNIAIDQHFLARNRHFDMLEIVNKKPGLLGVGIDESTAMIVRGDVFEIFGPSYVVVYDGNFWSKEGTEYKKPPSEKISFYFLKQGDKYNMRERKVIK
jgi:cyanophycinase